ncbi:alpha/beta fold hydrolase [Gilvimarinus sp. SDUM040013]|uniref:Alpha/beta fold hydrolase n=1 Tax=Gilvimarinus gilvus TaxID=3058038 RepID=A0ABU4RSC8_9GAMM|nr:alpha/beta fold hydrolase [Gilvimarinus sp. SDUM040013]MDO3388242.1 alpha/beta fold hydrolase [Gilvimarinus sp. SDUM040013]MDX6847792.1 alpha/beta fold hydrolase [Gilvimarinus sp. SDUM040013]
MATLNPPVHLRALFYVFLMVISARSFAAPSLEDYGNLPAIDHVAVSPDGERIAFRRTLDGTDAVYVIAIEDNKYISGIDVSRVKPRDIYFLNNESLFILASDHRRISGFRGKHEISTGYVLNIKEDKIHQLLKPGDGVVYPGQTGLGRVVGVSPDSQHVYMPAYFGKAQKFNGGDLDPSFSLLRVTLDGLPRARLHRNGSKNAIDFFVSQAGELLVLEEFDDEKDLHTLTAFSEDGDKIIFQNSTQYITHSFVGLTADERHIVMVNEDSDTGRSSYYLVSLANGEIIGPMHSREGANIMGVVSNIQRVVQGVVYSGFTPTYKFFNEKLDQRVKVIQGNFPEHSVSIASHSPDWKNILVLVEGSQSPGDYYLFSEGEQAQFITTRRPNIEPESVNPIAKVTFKARDGLPIPTLITIPRDRISDMTNLPAVVMPHGGPASYDNIGFNYWAQALASQGYMVIMPQFRGSSGFGLEHELAGHGEWGGKMQDDVTDALKFALDKGMVDPERVCIVGASYGGYSALAGGAFSPDLYKCVVSINGIGDLKDFRNWTRKRGGRSSASVAYWETQIGGEEYTDEIAEARSPARHAKNFLAPVLLIHAEDDEIVDISQSKDMRKALTKADKNVTFVELEGDDHWLSNGEMRLKALKETVKFINQHI